jgi:hypothetical protein
MRHTGRLMLAILAAVTAGVGFVLNGVGAHTSPWFSPTGLLLAAAALLALHLAGVGPRKP